MLYAVLKTAFRGCGTTIGKVKTWPKFRKVLAEQQRLAERHPPSSPRGVALRAGHFAFGRACNPWETFDHRSALAAVDGIDDGGYDPETRALIIILGDLLVPAARKYGIPRKFHAWAREWRAAKTAEEQVVVARKVCRVLISRSGDTSEEDMRKQNLRRVLPRYYGRWKQTKTTDRSNCIGKAQMVAAFLELCGAETISLMPLTTSFEWRRLRTGEVGSMFLAELRKGGAVPYENFEKWLSSSRSEWLYERSKPSWPHLAVAAKLKSGRWLMLDPNFCGALRVPDAWELNRIAPLLGRYRSVLPGLTFLHRSSEVDDIIGFERMLRCRDAGAALQERLRRGPLRGQRAIDWLTRSRLLTEWNEIANRSIARRRKKSREKVERDGVCHTLQDVAVSLLLGRLNRSEWDLEELKAIIRDGTAVRLHLRGKAMDNALLWLPTLLYIGAFVDISEGWKKHGRTPFHPQCELGITRYQLALYTLMHCAVDMGCADAAAAELMEHGYGQYLLHNSQTLLYRSPETWRCTNRFAQAASEHLAELPYRLRSATIVLENLLQRKKGDADGGQKAA